MMRRSISIFLTLMFLWPSFTLADMSSAREAFSRGDYSRAYKEWLYLAERGNNSAQYQLGWMYSTGTGVRQVRSKAYMWYSLAAKDGHQLAKQMLGLLKKKMTPSQIQTGERFYRDFRPRRDDEKYVTTSDAGDSGYNKKPANTKSAPSSQPRKPSARSYPEVNRKLTEKIQEGLAKLGYKTGPIDGVLGEKTTNAIMSYQKDNGIQPDGVVSTTLLAIINFSIAKASKATPEEYQEPKLVGSGSGFTVSTIYAVTNNHVTSGYTKLVAHLDGKPVIGSVIASSEQDDLALVKLTEPASNQANFRGSVRARLGEEIRVVGFPLHGLLASSLNIASGEISALAGMRDNAKVIQISAPVQPGNSGGPLLDRSGNVIGVVVSKLDAAKVADAIGDIPQNINFAIKGAVVKSFLDIHGIDYQTASSDSEKSGEEIAAAAREYTVPVECYK